jgi:hypothetical protein
MKDRAGVSARRVAVPAHEPLVGDVGYDYADAFELRTPEPDPRTAEQFARAALEGASWPVCGIVRLVHRHLLRFTLAPAGSPQHVLGWTILASEPDLIQLEAVSPLLGRGVLVGRHVEPTRTVLTTYIFFTRPAAGRVVWAVVGPLHRRVAPYLLERAARTTHQPEGSRREAAEVRP